MPIYEYLCDLCAIKFEKTLKAELSENKQPCPGCSGLSDRVPSVVTPTFLGNTMKDASGLSSLDNNFDRLVGEDSFRQWHVIADREKEKLKILNENPEAEASDLKSVGGSYQVMTKQESKSFKDKFFNLKVKDKSD
jgi:putative FmdB family regulatory protein